MGRTEKGIGKKVAWKLWVASNPDSLKIGRVIGIVKDFNYKSLYDKVETTVLQIFPDAAWKVAVKIKTAGMANNINHVRSVWNKINPYLPIENKFYGENFWEMYHAEKKAKTLPLGF